MIRKIKKEYIVKSMQTKGQYITAWDNEGTRYDFFKGLNVYDEKKVNSINDVDLTGVLYVGIKVNQVGSIEKHIFNRLGYNLAVVCSKEVRRLDYVEVGDLENAVLFAVEDKEMRKYVPSELKNALPSIQTKIDELDKKENKDYVPYMFESLELVEKMEDEKKNNNTRNK